MLGVAIVALALAARGGKEAVEEGGLSG